MEEKVFKCDFAGRELTIKTGKLAPQASGSAVVSCGDTVVLAAVTVAAEPKDAIDFFPLMVEYQERFYAAGRISSSRFVKREGKPSDQSILTARLIDRPIRPLFPEGYYNDVQIVVTVLAYDGENDPDVLSIIAASTALGLSVAPFAGPLGAMHVGYINGELVFNPTMSQIKESKLDIVVAAIKDKIMMLEAGAKEISEDLAYEAITKAHEALQPVIALQEQIARELGKPKQEVASTTGSTLELVLEYVSEKIKAVTAASTKAEKEAVEEALEQELLAHFKDQEEHTKGAIKNALHEALYQETRRAILEDGKRPDGRDFNEVRPLYIEAGVLPRVHGSAIFMRGETQVLNVITLGAPSLELLIEDMNGEFRKRYMHHYNFPPYSTGEVKPMRSVGRREIGHGALAERALEAVLPSAEEFPYTIRTVSEVLSSNGSSSMASTCASCLALMDAGVPLKAPVAGIAIGLMTNPKNPDQYKVLTDIAGIEDGGGDMDFKVTGTTKGITAIQLDIKPQGISHAVVKEALEKALAARLFILEKMAAVLPAPRAELSSFAPRVAIIHINPEKIRDVIGQGGKVINKIISETGAQIDIDDDGTVKITSVDPEGGKRALDWVNGLTREARPGEIFMGRVTRLMDFGAFVEILPNQEGLVHISQLAEARVEKVSDVVNVGDEIPVKVIEIDSQGRINLSLKAAKREQEDRKQ